MRNRTVRDETILYLADLGGAPVPTGARIAADLGRPASYGSVYKLLRDFRDKGLLNGSYVTPLLDAEAEVIREETAERQPQTVELPADTGEATAAITPYVPVPVPRDEGKGKHVGYAAKGASKKAVEAYLAAHPAAKSFSATQMALTLGLNEKTVGRVMRQIAAERAEAAREARRAASHHVHPSPLHPAPEPVPAVAEPDQNGVPAGGLTVVHGMRTRDGHAVARDGRGLAFELRAL